MGSWSLASPAEAWPGHGLVALGLTWGLGRGKGAGGLGGGKGQSVLVVPSGPWK